MPEQRPLNPNRSAANVPWHDAVGSSSGPPGTAHGNERTPDEKPLVVLPQLSSEATVMLEFLLLGRQSILNRAGRTSVDHDTRGGDCASLKVPGLWDLAVPLETARRLLAFHEENLARMHNAVHMPTFRQEFESALIAGSPCDQQWQTLYYAILCVSTAHHADEEDLLALDPSISPSAVQDLYNKCLTTLFNSNFMAIHSISSIQAICILLQVAHNLNQSDFIMVLMSATIRIAQSLNLHRLGSEKADHRDVREDPARTVQDLIDLEVKKRVWWFIVRQDWLQVPFQNTSG
ncbi:hypothetical protein MAP00_006694 [Monascus purpureus]|nr:hypothetical protein MAP00_006694 [Monascus purpureus]